MRTVSHFKFLNTLLWSIWFGVFAPGIFCSGESGAQVPGGVSTPEPVALSGTVFESNETPTLEWSDVPGALSYTLEYADSPDFENSTTIAGIPISQYTLGQSANPSRVPDNQTVKNRANYQALGVHMEIEGSLRPRPWPTTYYWRVKAVGQQVESSFSAVDNFELGSALPTTALILIALILIGYMVWQIVV